MNNSNQSLNNLMLAYYFNDFLIKSNESPWRKSVLAAIMGGVSGIGFGIFFGTFDGAHGEILGNTNMEKIKYATLRVLKSSWQLSKRYAFVYIILNRILQLLVLLLHMLIVNQL